MSRRAVRPRLAALLRLPGLLRRLRRHARLGAGRRGRDRRRAGRPARRLHRPAAARAAAHSPTDIVRGFLDAMPATPLQHQHRRAVPHRAEAATAGARAATITYAAASPPRGSDRVTVELAGADQLDAAAAPGRARCRRDEQELTLPDGSARTASGASPTPPDALVVPEPWFGQPFRQVSLYFFDPTAQHPGARAGLRAARRPAGDARWSRRCCGPAGRLRGVERSRPARRASTVDLSVPVDHDGRRRGRPDRRARPMPTERDAALMVAQLAWTLRQDPTLDRLPGHHRRRAGRRCPAG